MRFRVQYVMYVQVRHVGPEVNMRVFPQWLICLTYFIIFEAQSLTEPRIYCFA